MKCEYKNTSQHSGPCVGEVCIRGAMTQFHFEGVANSPEDPNRDFAACDAHYEMYEEHWQQMWDEVHADQMAGIRDWQLQQRQEEQRNREENARYVEQYELERDSKEEDDDRGFF